LATNEEWYIHCGKIVKNKVTFLKLKMDEQTLIEFILKVNNQSDCFPLEEDYDKLSELKDACKEKSIKEVLALAANLDVVDSSIAEWRLVMKILE
jgi:Tfp pilus assembly PilM family ATPase